jgi:hypothetical protein
MQNYSTAKLPDSVGQRLSAKKRLNANRLPKMAHAADSKKPRQFRIQSTRMPLFVGQQIDVFIDQVAMASTSKQ